MKKFLVRTAKFFVLLALTFSMPGFLFSAPAHASASSQNTFVAELKSTDLSIFKNDPGLISEQPVFVDSKVPEFQRTFKIQSTYSQNQFSQLYGSDITYIQPEHKVTAGFVSVNDPGFSTNPVDVNSQWGLLKANFPNAWDKTKGSSSVVVAIIDTGIDGSHEDLSSGQVGPGYDFTQKTYIQLNSNSDDNGHGTLVAGIIGATPNNFRGISGTDWNVTLMPLKALDSTGSGNSADVASAIVWAADHSANIINMSLGGIGFGNDTTLSDAISYAFNKGVVIVAAAGNDVSTTGGNMDLSPVFPVCDDNGQNMVIGVAASDVNDQKATFSNYGKTCVDVSAPGKRILSTINHDPITHLAAPNSYAYASGTSLAAPFVSGEAALIKAVYPNATNKEIRDRIIRSTDNIDALNTAQCAGGPCTGLIGSGRINAAAALNPNLISVNLTDGSLVQPDNSSQIYLIQGGLKDPVSEFVYRQRFNGASPQVVPSYLLDPIATGPALAPNDGTLIKSPSDPTVYYMMGGFKRPITFQIWQQRGFQPSQINILGDVEIQSWPTTTFLPPQEGTLVRDRRSPTVYWVIDGLLHPINRQFYLDRGLYVFGVMILNGNDLKGYAQGNPFIR